MDKVLAGVIKRVAIERGIDRTTAELIYTDMFKFIRKSIEEIDFDQIKCEDDMRRIKTNFNIPRIFKLYTIPGRIYYARERIAKSDTPYVERVMFGNKVKQAEGIKSDPNRSDGIE